MYSFIIDSAQDESDTVRSLPPPPPYQEPPSVKPFRSPLSKPATFLPWSYQTIDSTSESDLNDFYEDEEDGSESGYSTASSSQYHHSSTPPYAGHPTDLSTVAEATELIEDENGYESIKLPGVGGSVSHVRLPHVPLRPFRNQVGGHSAIYKFTRRAVCKVSQG